MKSGYWLLAFGYWLLAVGLWLLAFQPRFFEFPNPELAEGER